jgi:hypothetical protein
MEARNFLTAPKAPREYWVFSYPFPLYSCLYTGFIEFILLSL